VERFLSQALIAVAAAVAAIIFVATAAIFLGAALYLFLVSLSAAPPLAALLVGLAGLVLAGLIALAVRMTWRCRRTGRTGGGSGSADPGRAGDAAGDVADLAAQLGSLAARELASQAQAHPYRAVVVSLLAGLAVGGSPALRNMLEKMLKN
jgi:hypothetical protein